MQRPPYNSGFPNGPMGGPMGPNMYPGQMPPNAGFGPGRPMAPGPAFGQPGPGQHPQNFQPGNSNCFMPAATIRKISNTTPPKFN